MTYETKQAYSEVCAVLENMPNEYISKIPKKIIKLFETERLTNYEPNINKFNPLDKNKLSKKAMVIIAMLNYQYWCPNKKVKDDLYKTYLSNNDKYQREIEKKYSVDNLFKNKNNITQVYNEVENVAMVEYKESVFKRIINKIKNIFHK
ncbi:unknown [Clostridium sp. CAG:470]|nr:MAG: hypothetical protein BHW03_00635 [Clostridium sp. 28_17]CDE14481.1 unknown [Clostridium sp. CAG:470]